MSRISAGAALFFSWIFVFWFFVAAPITPAFAETPDHDSRLKKLEREISQREMRARKLETTRRRIEAERTQISRKLRQTGKTVRRSEITLDTAERRLSRLQREQVGFEAGLSEQRQELSRVIGALIRIGRQPMALAALAPDDLVDHLRRSRLLSAALPELQSRARVLNERLKRSRRLRDNVKRQKQQVSRARDELKIRRREIKRLLRAKLTERAKLRNRAKTERKRLAALASSARDLRDLLGRLERHRVQIARAKALEAARVRQALGAKQPGPAAAAAPVEPANMSAVARLGRAAPARLFSLARGRMPLPANGRIVRHFGVRTKLGQHARGISISTRPGAQIVSPHDGEVVFAGPFRGYGLLLIISHGEGYHTLMSGASLIHVVVGQRLLANEPVGEMGGDDRNFPTLYVELRHRGEAINPLPWLAARNG